MDYEEWMNLAISKTGALKDDSVFLVKDLFDGIRWRELGNGEKREFGRQFRIKVERGLIPGVVYIGKAQNNSAQYRKEQYNESK